MVQMISFFLPILWVCFTAVHCQRTSVDPWWDPRVWPETFVHDDKPFVELTCGAYLRSNEGLSWRSEERDTKNQYLSLIQQSRDGYRTLKVLWPLASLKDEKLYCRKSNGTGTQTHSKSIPITYKNNSYPEIKDDGYGPWLWLTTMDGGKRMKFTSYAYLDKSGNLTCYLKKEDKTELRLGMIQQENAYSYVKITIEKTLEPSDNGSEIYCTKQDKRYARSSNTPITFERQALEPYVTVEPSTDVVFFDEGDDLDFICGGSDSDDFRILTWYLETPGLFRVTPPGQDFYESTNENRLALRLDVFNHEQLLYCAQESTFTLSNGTVKRYTNLRSETITLLHRARCGTRDRPRVLPTTFLDEHKPCIQMTCYAYLKPGELLSWYQSTDKPAGSLLRMIQLQDPETKEGEWTVLTLNKTLEPSDNGSEIYCAQQSVRADGSYSDLNLTERIPLTIQRDIMPLERPFIDVEPNNANVSFDVNTTLRLTCRGSRPVDGRAYTWFKKELNSSLTVPTDQKYDASTNLNVLYLSLNESHHLNKLFCAQGFLSYIRHTDGSPHVKSYGELVTSNIITLIQQDKHLSANVCPVQSLASCNVYSGNTRLLLSVATPLALLSLVVAAVACWALRRRRAAPPAPPVPAPRDNTDDIYANVSRMTSPEVTYAVLDLPRGGSAARAPPAPDQTLYAEIARVSPQVTYANLDLPKPAPAPRAPPAPEPSLYAEIARDCKRKQ